MTRAKNNVASKRRHKKYLKLAKGFYGARRKNYRIARESVERAWVYSYFHRRTRKRDFRKLWIIRINAAARNNGTTYSRFMFNLKKNNINIDRKMLADMAVNDRKGFSELVGRTNI